MPFTKGYTRNGKRVKGHYRASTAKQVAAGVARRRSALLRDHGSHQSGNIRRPIYKKQKLPPGLFKTVGPVSGHDRQQLATGSKHANKGRAAKKVRTGMRRSRG